MPLKILYLSVNSSYSHSSPVYGQLRAFSEEFCLGIITLEWHCVNTTINQDFDLTLEEILRYNPDLIISTAYLFNIDTLKHILSRVKALFSGKVTIILGGPEFSGDNKAFLLSNRFIDAVFRSDESALQSFLNAFHDKKQWQYIKGINFIDSNGDYIDNGFSQFKGSLDSLPSPYASGYFSADKPFIHFETSRGCPSKCAFCSSAESPPAFYSTERVFSDLTIIKNSGIREIRVLDRTFNFPEERAIQMLNMFIGHFPEMRFHLEIDPFRITDAFVDTLRRAPASMFHIEAGIQSFSSRVLPAVNRPQNREVVINNLIKLCSLKNIQVHTDLIAGLPLQTPSDILEDINSLVRIAPDEIQLEVLKILPGSPLSKNLPADTFFSSMPPYEVLLTPDIAHHDFLQTKTISRIIDACYNEKKLKVLFMFALETDSAFLISFASLYSCNFSHKEKPSLEKRAALFADYADRTNNLPLKEMVIFTSLLAGIIPKTSSLKITKNNSEDKRTKCLVWKNRAELSSQYAIECTFDFDPMEYFLHGTLPKNNQSSSYIFYYPTLSFSKTISHIEKLIHIN